MKTLLSKLTALVTLIIGVVISIPFFVCVFILGRSYHTMSFPVVIMSVMFMVGAVLTLLSIVNLAVSNPSRGKSMLEQDVSRIRFASEMTDKK